eukprot:jgi/Chrzof1/12989/Cz07g15140.t1
MANYLKKYIDQVADVPGQLQRFFKLLGDLEDRVVALQADVDAKCKDHIAKAHSSSKLGRSSPSAKRQKTDASTSALGQEIDVSMQKILSLAEEKTKIAAQVYDFVDAHIRHLDEDLRSFEDEINGDRNELNLADDETACGKLGWDDGAPVVAAPAQPEQRQKRKYRKKGTTAAESVEASGDATATGAADAAVPLEVAVAGKAPIVVDSSEPRYCICNGVSYGEMIACDNPDCLIEWFHYSCVGITEQPKGKWYCPNCVKLKKAGSKAKS